VVIIASQFVPGGGFGGAWTAYPPLSADATYNLTLWGQRLWVIGVALEFVAFLMGGINFVTTTMNARAKGMKFYDIPIVVWFIVIASILFMVSVGPLIAGAVMLLLDQFQVTGFYNPAMGGDPLLWQHLFWFFGHPEVYVVLLPAIGVCAEIIPVFARKKLFAYKIVLWTAVATGALSFIVWAHHQFISGIDPRIANIFTITTLMISIPIAEMIFVYIATLYGGSIEFKTPMLWALAFIAEFLIGGCTGIYLGSTGTDIYFHDTYFVVAHFHFTFVPIAIIAVFAGITHWFPKASGRMLDETLGKIHFWGTIIPFTIMFLLMFPLGMAGQHRRIAGYEIFEELAPYQDIRVIITYCLIAMIAFQFVFFYNVIVSLLSGKKAEKNPWRANTLEWQAPNVPPHGNFPDGFPEVNRGPYEYSVPGRKEDYWPQNAPKEKPTSPKSDKK
jgi:cytochrome c oxidase subunit 1